MRHGRPVAPFLRVSDETVDPGPWRLGDDQGELADRLEYWDPDTNLLLQRQLLVDLDRLKDETHLGGGCRLDVASLWRSDRTRLRAAGTPVPLDEHHGLVAVSVALEVPGGLVGGTLEVRTVVVRGDDDLDAPSYVARRAGAILWEDRVLVDLEGGSARFPVTVLDFSTLPGVHPDAAWALDWSPHELGQPVLGALRLLVNARNDVVVRAVTTGNEDPVAPIVSSAIRYDVARTLVYGALMSDEFRAARSSFETDSVGRMLSDLLDRYWPGVDTATLSARLHDVPHRLNAELQAGVGLLAP